MITKFEQGLKKHKKELRDLVLKKRSKKKAEKAAETRFEKALKNIPRNISWSTMHDPKFATYMKRAEKIDLRSPMEKAMSDSFARTPISEASSVEDLIIDRARFPAPARPKTFVSESKPREGVILASLEIKERKFSHMLQREVDVEIQTAVILSFGVAPEIKVYTFEHQNPYGHIWIEKNEWAPQICKIIYDLANEKKFMVTLFKFRSPREKRKK